MLIMLFLGVIGVATYVIPLIFRILENSSYTFVVLFLFLILSSNILAKIARSYINL